MENNHAETSTWTWKQTLHRLSRLEASVLHEVNTWDLRKKLEVVIASFTNTITIRTFSYLGCGPMVSVWMSHGSEDEEQKEWYPLRRSIQPQILSNSMEPSKTLASSSSGKTKRGWTGTSELWWIITTFRSAGSKSLPGPEQHPHPHMGVGKKCRWALKLIYLQYEVNHWKDTHINTRQGW